MTFFRHIYCGGDGGLLIADAKRSAVEKLEKKYGKENISSAEIWPWELDDHYDPKDSDVLNVYDI